MILKQLFLILEMGHRKWV